MKKALIVTHHWMPNFGANLQAYATCRLLEKHNFNVSFLDYRPKDLVNKYRLTIDNTQSSMHNNFVRKNLPCTDRIFSYQAYKDHVSSEFYDIYLTGSDAVFRLSANLKREDLNVPNPYWLPDIPLKSPGLETIKISLSPSAMGSNFKLLSARDKDWLRSQLNNFTALSARDVWTKKQMQLTGCTKKIRELADPVFTLTQEIQDYRLLGHNKTEKYILVASQNCLSSAWIKRFTTKANQYGYKTIALPSPEGLVDVGTNEKIQLPLDPLEWLKIIACSDGYIGGRFHPLVICMCAGVPVVSIDRYHKLPWQCRKSKSWLLLHKFNLNKFCLGRWAHFFITPHLAMKSILSQAKTSNRTIKISFELSDQIKTYILGSINSTFVGHSS